MGDVEVFTWWASGGRVLGFIEPTPENFYLGPSRIDKLVDLINPTGVRVLHTGEGMNAPNPIFEDWSEYPPGSREYVFSEKRKCGFAAKLQVAMWASLMIALALTACLFTVLIVSTQ